MKRKFIFTGKHGRPSTRLAFAEMKRGEVIQRRQFIKKKSKKHVLYYRVFDQHTAEERLYDKKEYQVTGENSVIIRWGTREPIDVDNKTVIYNKAEAIKKATNKKHSREIFIENNVSCPEFVTPNNFKQEFLPVIGRPFIHSKGKNFIILKTKQEFLNHYNSNKFYYSNFIDKTNEFRIHVAHSKVLAVMEKIKPKKKGQIAWNRAQNDVDPFEYVKWSDVDKRNLSPVLVEAIKAVNALGLDSGGVDVMWKDEVPFVLEVNTAPTLNSSPYVAKRWGMYFDWLFNREGRREHWEFEKFKKGQSLIWKNFQLQDKKQ